jgi:hypothetical protein
MNATELATIGFYSLYCGILWRLRGGAFASLSGINIGTQWTRVACGLLMAGPLWLVIGWPALMLAVAITLGLMITGWEEFQGMGTESGTLLTEKPGYWMRWLPRALGAKPGTIPYDMLGMMQAGMLCMAPTALVAWALVNWGAAPGMLMAGAEFAVAYLLARMDLPGIPEFAKGQEWGEVFTGVLIGAALGGLFFNGAGWSFT